MGEQVREAIELHDSELLSVSATAAGVCVKVNAYVHRLPAQLGRPGAGWCQEFELQFGNGVIDELSSDLPWKIMDGGISGSANHENIIPLPYDVEGDVCLEATGVNERSVKVSGTHLRIVSTGTARYVEETPADLYGDNWPRQ